MTYVELQLTHYKRLKITFRMHVALWRRALEQTLEVEVTATKEIITLNIDEPKSSMSLLQVSHRMDSSALNEVTWSEVGQ